MLRQILDIVAELAQNPTEATLQRAMKPPTCDKPYSFVLLHNFRTMAPSIQYAADGVGEVILVEIGMWYYNVCSVLCSSSCT